MEIELVPAPDDPVAPLAVERAALDAKLAPAARRASESAWWRAGLLDGLERASGTPSSEGRYDGAPPRSTRGATRA